MRYSWTCVEKIKNKNNQISNYIMTDTLGQTKEFLPDELRLALSTKQIIVTNLTLSKNNRIIDKKIKGNAYITPYFLSNFWSPKAISFESNWDINDIKLLCSKVSLLQAAKVVAQPKKHLYVIETDTTITIYSDYQLTFYYDRGIKVSPTFFKFSPYTSIDLSNTSYGLSDFSECFCGCKAKEIRLGNMDTSGIHNCFRAFSNLKLVTLDLSNLNTSMVTNMRAMFYGSSIENLIIPFNTSNVQNMISMFCLLKTYILDISTFDFSNVTQIKDIFNDCFANNIITNNQNIKYLFENRPLSLPFD